MVSHKLFILFIILALVVPSCNTNHYITNRYKVIAHRGYYIAADYSENSIAALKQAFKLGVDAVEFDVSKTVDDSLMIIHGPLYGGYLISDSKYEDIRKKLLPNGERPPTLCEYVEVIKTRGNLSCYQLEIKSPGIELQVINLLNKTGLIDKFVIVCFSWDVCMNIHRNHPNVRIAYLGGDKTPNELKNAGVWAMSYEMRILKKSLSWLDEARQLGIVTMTWLVETESDLIWCATHKVDYIGTDNPLEAIQFLNNYE